MELAVLLGQASPSSAGPRSVVSSVDQWVRAFEPLFWPAIAGFAIWYAIKSRLIETVISRLRSVSGFGIGFEFSETGAAITRDQLATELSAIRTRLKREYDRLARKNSVPQLVQKLVDEAVRPHLVNGPEFRCTVHVPDALYGDYLYQLVDYYPHGGGRGRSFSSRVGLIGRVWRGGTSMAHAGEVTEPLLISEWGMTAGEAAKSRASGKRSFLCVLLSQPESVNQVGVLYFDSPIEAAFGATGEARDALLGSIQNEARTHALINCLATIKDEMSPKSPEIDLALGEGSP